MEFIKDNFSNPSSNLLISKSSPYNTTNSNNKTEKNELINNGYIFDSNKIKVLYNNSSNDNNKNSEFFDSNIGLNNNKTNSKSNNEYPITPSPILSLTTIIPTKKSYESNNDPYKLSPSASNSSIPESNLSIKSPPTISSTKTINESSNQSKSLPISLTSPVLSNENLHELISKNTTKPVSYISTTIKTQLNNNEQKIKNEINPKEKSQFPYTPSSSLSFISSELELNKTNSIKQENDIKTFINYEKNESSSNNESKNLIKPSNKLLENIYNIEIYKPLNNYSSKDKESKEKEKIENSKDINKGIKDK